MKYEVRKNPLFSACGLNCGLCPRFYTVGTSRCPGCAGDGFSDVHPACGILSCCQRKGLEYCFLCDEFPCKKYDGADLTDSFITHQNQFKDMEKAKQLGTSAYEAELNEKVNILQELLANYDDGRLKGFFCLAVNLLDLADINSIMNQLRNESENVNNEAEPQTALKSRAEHAVQLFQSLVDKKGIILKLRK